MDISEKRQVGRSELSVTPLGFGGGTIGNPSVTNEESLATVSAAWNAGVRVFDTAPWYGVGRSERRLGLGLSGLGDLDEYDINTKIGKTLVPEAVRDESRKTNSPNGQVKTPRDPITGFRVSFNYSHDAIMAQHHDSLQRLGHSRVSSLTIHDIDYGYHSAEDIDRHLTELSRDGGGGAEALESLRASGAIKAIGCGCNLESRNAFSWRDSAHEDLCERILDTVDLDFFVVAGGYTLLETRGLRRILPLCESRKIGVIIAAPFSGGWLADPQNATTYMYAAVPQDVVDRSLAMADVCGRYNVPLSAVALQFVLAHPTVAAIIPGAKSILETEQNRKLVDVNIPAELWTDLKSSNLLAEEAPTPG